MRSSLAGHALFILSQDSLRLASTPGSTPAPLFSFPSLSLSVSSAVRILRPRPCFLLVSFRRRGERIKVHDL